MSRNNKLYNYLVNTFKIDKNENYEFDLKVHHKEEEKITKKI